MKRTDFCIEEGGNLNICLEITVFLYCYKEKWYFNISSNSVVEFVLMSLAIL